MHMCMSMRDVNVCIIRANVRFIVVYVYMCAVRNVVFIEMLLPWHNEKHNAIHTADIVYECCGLLVRIILSILYVVEYLSIIWFLFLSFFVYPFTPRVR